VHYPGGGNVDNIEDIAWYEAEMSAGGYTFEPDPMGMLDNHYAFCRPRVVRFGLGLSW